MWPGVWREPGTERAEDANVPRGLYDVRRREDAQLHVEGDGNGHGRPGPAKRQ